ncbi:hypothetical protein R8Z50_30900 [Longispora sp. K20-0274]|uniref:DUF6879 family protein n=1 Tax=Longispora sp. K20-0274 TaxID=3088255 RepID=UPI00399BEF30
MLSPAEFGALFDDFQHSAFRVELLPQYLVPEEAEEFRAYRAGEPQPGNLEDPWWEYLRSRSVEGRPLSRVHVVTSPLTDYLRYEFEWGYATSVRHGERISILDLAMVDYAGPMPDFDFWLFDDKLGVRMHYAPDGSYEHATLLAPGDIPNLIHFRESLLAAAVPFADYWAAHPEFHRD